VTKSIAIYIEGGGDTTQTLASFRTGMSAFLKPIVDVVRAKRIRWRVIACGRRKEAYYKFVDALAKEPDVFNVLLVDSEDPVAIALSPWDHVRSREDDKWNRPPGADDTHCHMMVACMEAWFLADADALKRHYGVNFDIGKLPPASQAESQTKDEIYAALKKATKSTKAGQYRKIRDGAKLLAEVDVTIVRKHCKWCQRMFKALGDVVETTV